MNEHQPLPPQGDDVELLRTSEHTDLRRLEVAYNRFADRINDGIAQALAEQTEIDDGTARCIAHILGRAHGRESALADFGRTGEGHYLTLRDEYLDLYTHERANADTKELIDWFGTYLVQRENTGTSRQFMNEYLPPKLDRLLVRTGVTINGDRFIVNIPASWHSGDVDGLIATLTDLQLPEDKALQAFLALPGVSAGTENIMESFYEAFAGTYPDKEAALRALSPLEDWENSLADWCIEHGIDHEALDWNLTPLFERLADVYALVEQEGNLHAFVK